MSYVSLGINILSGLIYTPWMISSIGQDNYGLYTLAMSVISLFVFDFGLSSAVTRFLSKHLAEGRQDKADQCLGLVYRLYLYIDIFFIIILSAVYFFIPQIYRELSAEEIESFKVIYVIAALFTIISFPFIPINGILTANEKFVQLKTSEVIHKLLIVASMTICLLMGYGLYALVIVNALSGVATILLKLWFIKKYTRTQVLFGYRDRLQFREIIGFSVWATVIAICQRMIFTIAPTILGIFAGSIPIAIFGIANTIEGYVFSFSNALSGMFLPRVSRVVSRDGGDVMPLMIKIGRIQLYVVGAVVMGFICVGKEFISLWVGDSFLESYYCTILLIIPSIFQLPQEIGMQTIIAENKVKQQATVWVLVATVNIALSFLMTWLYGVMGLCFSICISFFVRTIGMDVIFKRELHIDVLKFFRETFIKIGLMILAVTILSSFVNKLLLGDGMLMFIIKAMLFGVLYVIGFIVVANEEERTLVKQTVLTLRNKIISSKYNRLT